MSRVEASDAGRWGHRLEHGGRLREAAQRYGVPLADWLDLSTGINPRGWPVPELPPDVWSRLPENEDVLEDAARAYYGTESLLAVAGSQAAIQALPRFRKESRVVLLEPGYSEHAHAWRAAGHRVTPVGIEQLEDAAPQADVLLLINPNNPTGARFAVQTLLDWHAELEARGGWLVVDEAFMDASPEHSMASYCPRPGLILLRSLGKFFGLAGARVGFVLGEREILERLDQLLGPWAVGSPARWVAARALADRHWQERTRAYLAQAEARLAGLIASHGLSADGGCRLFQWTRTPRALRLRDELAQRGIWVRLFASPSSLRFGLPPDESGWRRLESALSQLQP